MGQGNRTCAQSRAIKVWQRGLLRNHILFKALLSCWNFIIILMFLICYQYVSFNSWLTFFSRLLIPIPYFKLLFLSPYPSPIPHSRLKHPYFSFTWDLVTTSHPSSHTLPESSKAQMPMSSRPNPEQAMFPKGPAQSTLSQWSLNWVTCGSVSALVWSQLSICRLNLIMRFNPDSDV